MEEDADLSKITYSSYSECCLPPFSSQALKNGSINLAQHSGLSDLVPTHRNHFAYKNLFGASMAEVLSTGKDVE